MQGEKSECYRSWQDGWSVPSAKQLLVQINFGLQLIAIIPNVHALITCVYHQCILTRVNVEPAEGISVHAGAAVQKTTANLKFGSACLNESTSNHAQAS
jgi:hypothetical protein